MTLQYKILREKENEGHLQCKTNYIAYFDIKNEKLQEERTTLKCHIL